MAEHQAVLKKHEEEIKELRAEIAELYDRIGVERKDNHGTRRIRRN